MVDLTIPLLIGLIGGPAAVIIKFWYKKKDSAPSRFHDSGTYVRDDSLYSYDDTKTTNLEDKSSGKDEKNNS